MDAIQVSSEKVKGKRILLAVSGGLDSVCLADYFIRNQKSLQFSWAGIAHIHHGLRKNAEQDAEFVQNFAYKLNVPFFIRHLDGNFLKSHGSIEENARIARYKALHEIASLPEVRAENILTAHHANDQAETVLMRILRGTTLKGLQGIQQSRMDGIERPFLSVKKERIEAYAKAFRLDFREDESNADETFDRNSIRRRLLPEMVIQDSLAIDRLCQIADISQSAYPKILASIRESVSPYLVTPSLWPFPAETSPYRKVLALHDCAWENLARKSTRGAATLLRIWLDSLGFSYPSKTRFLSNFANREKTLLFEKKRHILWFCQELRSDIPHNLYLFGQEESISGKWRFRKDGDLYVPSHGQPKTLKKWFEENGIPLFARDSIPLFSQGHRILRIGGIPPLDKGKL